MLTADNEIYIVSQLPPSVPDKKEFSRLFLTLVLFQIHTNDSAKSFPPLPLHYEDIQESLSW